MRGERKRVCVRVCEREREGGVTERDCREVKSRGCFSLGFWGLKPNQTLLLETRKQLEKRNNNFYFCSNSIRAHRGKSLAADSEQMLACLENKLVLFVLR